MDAKSIDYDQTVECHGIQIPIVRRIVNERLLQSMRRERYERGEVTALRGIVKPTDKFVPTIANRAWCRSVLALG